MTDHRTADGLPVAFHDLPADAFPVQLYAFNPGGDLVWNRTIQPHTVVHIPGTGPGSVRYVVTVYANGEAELFDDPSCSGTLPEE